MFGSVARLFDHLDEKSLVLTANRRLSRYVQKRYDESMGASENAWRTLECYSLQGWLQSKWDAMQQAGYGDTSKIILTATQEQQIWQTIVETHSEEYQLLNQKDAAKLARSAWQTLVFWQLNPEQVTSDQNDVDLFKTWCKHFFCLCQEKGVLDAASMQKEIVAAVDAKYIDSPSKIFLIGFDSLTPLITSLLNSFELQGTEVNHISLEEESSEQVRFTCRDSKDEMLTATRWASCILEKQPKARIGIVCPQLANALKEMEQVLYQVFEPQYCFPQVSRHAPAVNISAAQPLSNTPPIKAALLALNLNRNKLDINTISAILGSPFLGIDSEFSERALIELDLRTEPEIKITRLRRICGQVLPEKDTARCPDFYQRLQEFHQLTLKGDKYHLPSEWASLFHSQVLSMGWPGSRTLDTIEYQQVQMWQEAIQNLRAMDSIFNKISFSKAYSLLQSIFIDRPFHAQTQESPIQVLGLLEAAGMPFDYLWVMGLDNHSWPMAPKPNPFLPIELQRESNMPNATAQRELDYAKKLTQRFARSAKKVVFSFAQYNGDQKLTASRLIEDFEEVDSSAIALSNLVDYSENLLGSAKLESLDDSRGPIVSHPKEIKGGTQIIKDQAACPFRAFAKHRLHTNEIAVPAAGISPIERGNLVHNVLEIFWRKTKSQQQLLAQSESETDKNIKDAISSAFLSTKSEQLHGVKLKKLESERIFNLVRAWIELEKRREPFTVAFNEAKKNIVLADMPLQVRYDRVDRLDDDSLLVIDYKTGTPSINQWAGDRPDEPQVPIYAVASSDTVTGAAIGQLSSKEVCFKGISEREEIAPGLKIPEDLARMDLPGSWQEILSYWKYNLERLSREFTLGYADVNPKKSSQTCQFCSLQSLCRIKQVSSSKVEASNASDQND